MNYCERCKTLTEENACALCKKAVRTAENTDLVLLASFKPYMASMAEEILRDNAIPYERKARLGAGLAMYAGDFFEEITFFVPYEQLENATETLAPLLLPYEEGFADEDDENR